MCLSSIFLCSDFVNVHLSISNITLILYSWSWLLKRSLEKPQTLPMMRCFSLLSEKNLLELTKYLCWSDFSWEVILNSQKKKLFPLEFQPNYFLLLKFVDCLLATMDELLFIQLPIYSIAVLLQLCFRIFQQILMWVEEQTFWIAFRFLILGFELELYSVHDYCMVYWYIYTVLIKLAEKTHFRIVMNSGTGMYFRSY